MAYLVKNSTYTIDRALIELSLPQLFALVGRLLKLEKEEKAETTIAMQLSTASGMGSKDATGKLRKFISLLVGKKVLVGKEQLYAKVHEESKKD